MGGKRTDYISWDEYFMAVAKLAGMRSKDPNTQVGACIVSQSNKILSMGYNGFPLGCSDDEFPWARVGVDFKLKCQGCGHIVVLERPKALKMITKKIEKNEE